MASSDRAINMALRVLGIGEVERDFKRVGAAGDAAFGQVAKAANGADREVSEYTARLKRAVEAAKGAVSRSPDFHSLRLQDPGEYRTQRDQTILQAVNMEKNAMREGLAETAAGWDSLYQATEQAAPSLTRAAAAGAAAGAAMALAARFVTQSAEAYMEHERALDAFNAKLALQGNYTNATAGEIEDMARRVKDSTLQTEEAALQAAATLAKVPDLTRSGLQEALDVSALLADALGVDVTDTAKSTGEVLTALANNDVKALYDATEDLRPSLRLAILELAEAGKTADAQRVYLDGLRQAAGDGPDGLTTASDRLGDAWDRLKTSFGEDASGPAIRMLNGIAGALDWVREKAHDAMVGLRNVTLAQRERALEDSIKGGTTFLGGMSRKEAQAELQKVRGARYQSPATGSFARNLLGEIRRGGSSEAAAAAEVERRWGGGSSKPRGGGGGGRARTGKSDAEREAERIKREAEQAREAADRIIESNDDVIASYALRAQEIEAKVGLEGAALKAVERQQAIEAAARRINRDEIEKEVAARRAAALVAGQTFDEAAATQAATDAVAAKAEQLRILAAREIDAADAIAAFNKRQAEAKAFAEMVKTPLEQLNDDIERSVDLLRNGTIGPEEFDRHMQQLAEDLADVRYEMDEGAQAWRGFGQDVGRTLTDLALNGGSARDILMELIRLPLERLLVQNIENPIADFIDGLTGNNRDKNVAAARADLPNAAASVAASSSLEMVGTAGLLAAQGLNAVAMGTGDNLSQLGADALGTGNALADMQMGLGRVDGAMMDFVSRIASMSFGGGGGGGGLSSLLGFGLQLAAGAATGGGGSGAGPYPGYGDGSNMTGGIKNFASGTDRLPVGEPFWVGENGREQMELTRGGGIRVHSYQRSHRMVEGGAGPTIVNQTFNVPARSDPRRTASTISRATQTGLSRAAKKGLAGGSDR